MKKKILRNDIKNIMKLDDIKKIFQTLGFDQYKDINNSELRIAISENFIENMIVIKIADKNQEKKFKSRLDLGKNRFLLLVTEDFHNFTFMEKMFTYTGYEKYRKLSFNKERISNSILNKLNCLKKDKLNTFEDIFDKSAVVDTFYEKYIELRKELIQDIKFIDNENEKYQYAQLLLDRMIFLYFIQKKGLLDKDELYIGHKLKYCIENGKNFLIDFLNHIFFDFLAEKNENLINLEVFGEIPYLNGGLFRKQEIENNVSNIPNEFFVRLVKFFDSYYWYSDENADYGEESSISPEILGHIFEKTLNVLSPSGMGQKEKGAFYTPEKITNLICRKTIHSLICRNLGRDCSASDNQFNQMLSRSTTEDLLKICIEIMPSIRLLDNACGSGAFLLKALDVMLEIWQFLCYKLIDHKNLKNFIREILNRKNKSLEWLKWNFDNYEEFAADLRWRYLLKRYLINNCIYGVDLEVGAVEIAKLRLWLAMVSETNTNSDQVEPLPNIEYNLRSGNSLIGFTKIPQDNTQCINQIKINEASIKKISEFRPDLGETIRSIVKTNDLTQISLLKSKLTDLYTNEDDAKINNVLRQIIEDILSSINDVVNNHYLTYINRKTNSKKQLKRSDLEKLRPFHWSIEFPDIFQNKNRKYRGFDIICGNPPYGNILGSQEKNIIETLRYEVVKSDKNGQGNKNAAAIFIERSKYLLNKSGRFGYIVPKSLLYIKNWSKTRYFLLNKVELKDVIDCSRAFKDVLLEMCIIIYNNQNHELGKFVNVQNFYLWKFAYLSTDPYTLSRKFLNNERFIIEMNDEKLELVQCIQKRSVSLNHYCEQFRGLNLNSAVKKINTPNCIEIIKGKHLQRYHIRNKGFIDKSKIKQSKFVPGDFFFQRLVAHIENPFPHIKLTGAVNEENLISVNTVTNFNINESSQLRLNPYFLVGLLNSKIINWYVYKYIYVNAIRSMDFVASYCEVVPIVNIEYLDKRETLLLSNIVHILHIVSNLALEHEHYGNDVEFLEDLVNILTMIFYLKPAFKARKIDLTDLETFNIFSNINFERLKKTEYLQDFLENVKRDIITDNIKSQIAQKFSNEMIRNFY